MAGAFLDRHTSPGGSINNLITIIQKPTLESAQAIFDNREIRLLLVTGGPALARAALRSVPFEEICITSALALTDAEPPEDAFMLEDVPEIAVHPALAEGEKCARCWRILPDVGDHAHPGLCGRCDTALG